MYVVNHSGIVRKKELVIDIRWRKKELLIDRRWRGRLGVPPQSPLGLFNA